MTDIHFRHLEDWVGLYIKGKLKYQGHSIDEAKLLDILLQEKFLVADFDVIWDDDKWEELDAVGYPTNELDLGEHTHA